MSLEKKNASHKYDKKRPRARYKICLTLSSTKATFKAQFMKKLSNTEVELKKRIAYKDKFIVKTLTFFSLRMKHKFSLSINKT